MSGALDLLGVGTRRKAREDIQVQNPGSRKDLEQDPASVELGSDTSEDVKRVKEGKKRFRIALGATNAKSGLNTGS